MISLPAAYLYRIGVASGLAVMALTAYRRVTPVWLRRLLQACGVFVVTRYMAMALFTDPQAPEKFWGWRYCWFATSIGLALPSVFAVDQLLRLPTISPSKLLRWVAPLLAVIAVVMVFGRYLPQADPVAGWTLQLSPGWRLLLSSAQAIFTAAFVAVCIISIIKIPIPHTRPALIGLVLGHMFLAVDGLVLSFGGQHVRPFLYSEMLTLLALWYAYEVAARLPAS